MLLYLLSRRYADVAELVDALVLGTSVNDVKVQVLSSAPKELLLKCFTFTAVFDYLELFRIILDQKGKEVEEKYILKENNKEVGYIKYSIGKEEEYIIESIYIEEEYRGSGYARKIFDEFIEKAKKEERKITPICSYARVQFERRKELEELLKV